MKYIVLGDIYGRSIWKDIIDKEKPHITIFLGNYCKSKEQLPNLIDILNYKENNLDKVILLRGKYDIQYLLNIRDKFSNLTQWIYRIPDTNIICSNSGISDKFLDNVCKYFKSKEGWEFNIYDTDQLIDHINDIKLHSLFNEQLSYYNIFYSCFWIKLQLLLKYGTEDIINVIGNAHHICHLKKSIEVWTCNCLQNKEYLVIENNKFKPCKL